MFLRELCKAFYNPVILHVYKTIVYNNIFCYLYCSNRVRNDKPKGCAWNTGPQRVFPEQITALLDYNGKASVGYDNMLREGTREGNCPCDKIYDAYKVGSLRVLSF